MSITSAASINLAVDTMAIRRGATGGDLVVGAYSHMCGWDSLTCERGLPTRALRGWCDPEMSKPQPSWLLTQRNLGVRRGHGNTRYWREFASCGPRMLDGGTNLLVGASLFSVARAGLVTNPHFQKERL